LERAGARDVRCETIEFTRVPELRAPWTVNVVEAMRGVMQSIVMEGGSTGLESGGELGEVFNRMVDLAAEGKCYIRSDIHVHVAFKARDKKTSEPRLRIRARL